MNDSLIESLRALVAEIDSGEKNEQAAAEELIAEVLAGVLTTLDDKFGLFGLSGR